MNEIKVIADLVKDLGGSTYVAAMIFFMVIMLYKYKSIFDFFQFFKEQRFRKLKLYGDEYTNVKNMKVNGIEEMYIKKNKEEILLRLLTGIENSRQRKIYMYLNYYGIGYSGELKKLLKYVTKENNCLFLDERKYKSRRLFDCVLGYFSFFIMVLLICTALYFGGYAKNDNLYLIAMISSGGFEAMWLFLMWRLPKNKKFIEYKDAIKKINVFDKC